MARTNVLWEHLTGLSGSRRDRTAWGDRPEVIKGPGASAVAEIRRGDPDRDCRRHPKHTGQRSIVLALHRLGLLFTENALVKPFFDQDAESDNGGGYRVFHRTYLNDGGLQPVGILFCQAGKNRSQERDERGHDHYPDRAVGIRGGFFTG